MQVSIILILIFLLSFINLVFLEQLIYKDQKLSCLG